MPMTSHASSPGNPLLIGPPCYIITGYAIKDAIDVRCCNPCGFVNPGLDGKIFSFALKYV